jgi:hypothetical protein
MKNYMLFIREDLEAVKKMTEAEIMEDVHLMKKWVGELIKSGNYIQGDPLETNMRVVRKENIISDGPFIETKEAVSGYMLIKAESLEQAADIARACPALGLNVPAIEVRPILNF